MKRRGTKRDDFFNEETFKIMVDMNFEIFFCDKSVTSLSSSPAEVGEVNKEKCCGALAKGLDQQAFNLGAKTATGKFF